VQVEEVAKNGLLSTFLTLKLQKDHKDIFQMPVDMSIGASLDGVHVLQI